MIGFSGRDRSAMRAHSRLPQAYSGERLVRLDSDAGTVWIPESDGVIRPFLASRGTWEPEEGALLGQFFRPGLRFLDVGANVGYFSLLVAKRCRDAVIHAFEPHPLTSQVLGLNAWNSGADITVHAMALSGGDRLLALDTAPHNLGDTRASVSDAASMIVPAATLDEVLPDARFDLVKIDVQGFEFEAISGMVGMISRSPSPVIVAEFWPSALRERNIAPVAVLRAYKELGLEVRVNVGHSLEVMTPSAIVRTCDQAGPNGQVNIVLSKA